MPVFLIVGLRLEDVAHRTPHLPGELTRLTRRRYPAHGLHPRGDLLPRLCITPRLRHELLDARSVGKKARNRSAFHSQKLWLNRCVRVSRASPTPRRLVSTDGARPA